MSDFMDRIFKGSKELTKDAGSNAPTKKIGFGTLFPEVKETNHVWCTAPLYGASKCRCAKHAPTPSVVTVEEVNKTSEEK